MTQISLHNKLTAARYMPCGCGVFVRLLRRKEVICLSLFLSLLSAACIREPELHLPAQEDAEFEIPIVDLAFETYWNYQLEYGVNYDWRAEWVYGWDNEDLRIFGTLGYTDPTVFNVRRYYTQQTPYSPHTSVLANTVKGNTFHGDYNWGFWDILVWSDVDPTHEEVYSLNIDESTSLDSVLAYTNQSMRSSRFNSPRRTSNYTRAFYQPEQLFSAYDQGVEINKNLDGFVFDSLRNVYVKQLDMLLEPITYIYLTQVVLHNNKNKIIGVDGDADMSAMARTTNVNTGVAGNDEITVTYNVRFKPYVQLSEKYKDYIDVKSPDEVVAVAGGRLMTFGLCNHNGNRIKNVRDVFDKSPHYIDVKMQFNNGMDSTFVFDVSDKVRNRWKGGVITIELDMDTIPVPGRTGGSAFNAIVKDYEDGGTHEFEM